MTSCRHPCSDLIFEGPATGHAYSFTQIYRCRHCNSIQIHNVQPGRSRVGAWTSYPAYKKPGADIETPATPHLITPPPVSNIIPFPTRPPERPQP